MPTIVEDDRRRTKPIPASMTLFQQLAPESPMPAWLPRKEIHERERERLQPLDSNSLDIPWAPPRTPGRAGNLSSVRYDGIDLPQTPSKSKQTFHLSGLFQTPKNNPSLRVPGSVTQAFGTPRVKKNLGASGSLTAVLEDQFRPFTPSRQPSSYMEDSPARRRSSFLSSTPRYLGHLPVDESPIVRAHGPKGRAKIDDGKPLLMLPSTTSSSFLAADYLR
jgi:hypothetical protein